MAIDIVIAIEIFINIAIANEKGIFAKIIIFEINEQ
jgi:hypothetical protein